MKKPVLALTMGDPGGIGPEIIAKALQPRNRSSKFQYLVVGAKAPFELLQKKYGLKIALNPVTGFDESQWSSGGINFWDIFRGCETFDIGKVSKRNAELTYRTLEAAAKLAVEGKVKGIVTAPINKTTMRLIDPGFHGHTEFLAAASGVKKYAMMFVGPKLKVTLVTIHEPISKVSKLITREQVFEKIQLTAEFLKKRFRMKNPKLGVCALNPHGRETGTEDEKEIRPAVEKARRQNINALGPLSADQIFHDAYEGRFDAVISMYHDQGLAPFKMIAFRDGVNVTVGLPFVRTSPDHGTAFDIAYQNKADASSFLSSLRLAEKLI